MVCNNYILLKFGMFSFWRYNNREIFWEKLWPRCCRRYVYILPRLICTQSYEINTVFISTQERRNVRQGGEATCPMSHRSGEAGVERMQSDFQSQTQPLLRKSIRGGFLLKEVSLTQMGSDDLQQRDGSQASVHLSTASSCETNVMNLSSLSPRNVLCWMTQMRWQCMKRWCWVLAQLKRHHPCLRKFHISRWPKPKAFRGQAGSKDELASR